MTFGLGIRIQDDEIDKCRELMRPAWIAASLTNDLFSWPKEYEAAKSRGKDHVVNAIWVLMQEHSCDAAEAQRICRKLIKEVVAEYLQIVQDTKNNESVSADLRKYVEAMQYSISGNVVWSLTCPRYNPGVAFNDRQLAWINEGVPTSVESPRSGSLEDDSLTDYSVSTAPTSLPPTTETPGSMIWDLIRNSNLPPLDAKASTLL